MVTGSENEVLLDEHLFLVLLILGSEILLSAGESYTHCFMLMDIYYRGDNMDVL